MKGLYWNIETDKVETIDTIRSDYHLFADEYQTFDSYLSACMTRNNGALEPLYRRIEKLENYLRDFDYEPDEREAWTAEVARLKRMYLET